MSPDSTEVVAVEVIEVATGVVTAEVEVISHIVLVEGASAASI